MVEASGNYSPEDEELARGIAGKENFYKILNLEKSCTEDEIKKAYRKLALKVHPDKNKAPSAEQAFKKVGQAYACLSDPDKRKHYDLFGTEKGNQPSSQPGDINPEEIFRQMFGGHDIFSQMFQGGGSRNPMEDIFMRGGPMGGGGTRVFRSANGTTTFTFSGPGMGPGMGMGGFGRPQRRQTDSAQPGRTQINLEDLLNARQAQR